LRNTAFSGMTGLGFLNFDTEVDIEETQSGWEQYQGQPVTGRALVLSLGAGFRYNLSRRFDLIAQFEYNFTDSDRIDGYPTIPGSHTDGRIFNNDFYSFLTAGLSIKFGG